MLRGDAKLIVRVDHIARFCAAPSPDAFGRLKEGKAEAHQ